MRKVRVMVEENIKNNDGMQKFRQRVNDLWSVKAELIKIKSKEYSSEYTEYHNQIADEFYEEAMIIYNSMVNNPDFNKEEADNYIRDSYQILFAI